MDTGKEPSTIKMINLGLAFLLELVMLVIFGYVGVSAGQTIPVKIFLAVAFPAVIAIVWGIFLAPASKTRLRDPWLTLVKVFLFLLAAVCLFLTGLQGEAIVFAIIALLNLILLYIYIEEVNHGQFDRGQHGHS